MKKKVVVGAALMMMPLVSFAGGYLTNTNQHAAFLRSLSRGAAIDIDGALSNPAGLSFLPTDGFRVGVSIQSAFQTRDIDASFGTYNGFDPVNKVPTVSDVPYKKYYKGKAAAPVIPSVFAAYKKVIGPSPVSLPLRVGAVRHRLTMACRCSNRQLWLVYSRKVWGSI